MSVSTLSQLLPHLQLARNAGQTIVLATGVFDVLHQEHLRFLTRAKQAGDILIVGLESDIRVRQIKGPNRPINAQLIRAQNLDSHNLADHIFILPHQFNSPADHQRLIGILQPHILAVSSHTSHLPAKHRILKQYGGQVKIVHHHNPHISTTQILKHQPPQPTPTTTNHLFHTSVISGRGQGKQIGYPTLNLAIPTDLTLPHAVYAGWVLLNQPHPAAIHYGPIPTYHHTTVSLEAHLINTTAIHPPPKLYFQLTHRLRSIQTFPSPQALARQISKDVRQTLAILSPPNFSSRYMTPTSTQ